MPQPSTTLATLRPDLADGLQEFNLAADRRGFIGQLVLPVFEAAKQSGVFGKIPTEQLLKSRETKRAPGSRYLRGDWKFTTESFATEEHGVEEVIDKREAELYREYFDLEMVSAERALDGVLRAMERRIAALVFDASTFTGDQTTAVTIPWSTHNNATPVDDVMNAAQSVWEETGVWPNTLVVNRIKYRDLKRCAQIIERIESAGAGSATKAADITPEMLARVFDLGQVLVAGGAKDSANEGQDKSIASIWSSDYAQVCRIAETPDLREPCLGRIFHWGEDGSQIGGTVETYYQEDVRGDIVRVRHDVDEKVLFTDLGHLLTNING